MTTTPDPKSTYIFEHLHDLDFTLDEVKAALAFAAADVEVVTEPEVLDDYTGHSTCSWHAYDADGLADGGSLTVLWDWHNDEYFTAVKVVPVKHLRSAE